MALFQYGAFVTRISGSIGGTTFRQFGTSSVIQRKSVGGGRSKLLANNRLSQLAYVFRLWRTLTLSNQEQWNTVASATLFPDRFGNMRYISGRSFFTKSIGTLLPQGFFVYNPLTASKDISAPSLDGFVSDLDADTIEIAFSNITFQNYFLLQAELFTGYVLAPTFTRRKILGCYSTNTNFSWNIYSIIAKRFPNMVAGNTLRIYITPVSELGIRGASLVYETVLA
jgi:hypothetical protein